MGAIETIILETVVDDEKADVPKRWIKQLKEQHYWLQVVNYKGKVIFSSNTPDDLPSAYGPGELLSIQDTRRFRSYDVMMQLDDSLERSALFMMGYEDKGFNEVKSLFNTYSSEGLFRAKDVEKLNEVLRQSKNDASDE